MSKKDEIVAGLDLGATKVCAVVAELADSGELSILGVGTAGSLGVKQGAVLSMDETVDAIGRAVEEAETMSGVDIHHVIAGVGGAHMRGINNRASVTVKGGEVTTDDVAGVLEQVRAVELSRDDEIIHVSPQHYTLDSHDEIIDPIGMAGSRLSVDAHVIVGASTATRNLLNCVERAGLTVDTLVPQPVASAYAVLSPEELELGVALVDIGGGSTDLTIFLGGCAWHTWVLPLGVHHVTRDIAHVLSTPVRDAERLKVQCGTANVHGVAESELVEVPGVGAQPPRNAPRRLLAEVIEARMEEILALAAEEIARAGLTRQVGSGLVLTGGGALLDGVVELATRTTGMVARRGAPVGITGLTELASNPKNATAVGLARGALTGLVAQGSDLPIPTGIRRIRHWMKAFF